MAAVNPRQVQVGEKYKLKFTGAGNNYEVLLDGNYYTVNPADEAIVKIVEKDGNVITYEIIKFKKHPAADFELKDEKPQEEIIIEKGAYIPKFFTYINSVMEGGRRRRTIKRRKNKKATKRRGRK